MKLRVQLFALILGFGLAVPATAQEEQAKPEPAKEEPAKAEPAKEAPPAVEAPAKEEPAKEDAAKAAAEAAPAAAASHAAAPPAPAAPKELSSCAKSFVPLADSYKHAYDDMQKWIAQIDAETSAASDNVGKLQTQISENEAAITKAKLAGDNSKAKSIDKQNKQLWTDLNAAKKGLATSSSAYSKEAPARVKQYEAASDKAVADLKARAK